MAGWRCASCAGSNPDGTRFCGHCGSPNPDAALADALVAPGKGAAAARAEEASDERRLVTAVFADLSGFTALADQLDDPEALHEVIAPVVARLAEIGERYEGFIAKFAGDALLIFFGAPIAHEDDPARALNVALEMRERLPDIVAELERDVDLRLHIGVNTGRVVSGWFGGDIRSDYSILGDAVILAQRLESVAPSGEIYVGESTRDLAGDEFDFEWVGELALKGKLRPVPAWRLVARRDDVVFSATDVRLPSTPLVGREDELDSIDSALARLGAGRARAVAVTGEPGVGKTRLLGDVRRLAARRAVRWYQARCVTYGTSLPYWPYADLVRQVLGLRLDTAPADARARLEEAFAGIPDGAEVVGRLLGIGDAAMTLDPEAYRAALHRTFVDWFRGLADSGPVVIAIEDAHWADTASLALTADLARLGDEAPVAVMLTAREEGAAALAVVRAAGGMVVDLRPFDEVGVRRFLREVLGGEPPADLVRVVVARTAGNPLFIEEVSRSLREQEVLVKERNQWRLRAGWHTDDVPSSVERVVSGRIDRLPPTDARALQTAAAIGRVMRRSLLDAVLDDVADLDGALMRLVDAGFLDPTVDSGEEAVMFHHALVQEVAYGRLLRRTQREVHRRVAVVAEDLYGSGDDVIDLLARHYYLAGDGPAAVPYLVRAGRRARRLYANEEAIVHFDRAAEVARVEPHEELTLPTLLVELADLERVRGDHERSITLYQEARAAGAGLEAWLGLADAVRRTGDYDGALAVLDEAEQSGVIEAGEEQAKLQLSRAWTLAGEGRNLETVDVCFAGLDALGHHEGALAGQLLLPLARAESVMGRYEAALVHAERAVAAFRQGDDLRSVATALRVTGVVNLARDDHARAASALREALAVAELVGSAEETAGSLLNLGLAEQGLGDLDAAIECDRRAIVEFERIGNESGWLYAYANLGDKLLHVGRLEEARAQCEDALAKARELGYQPLVANMLHSIAGIDLAEGDPAAAADRAEAAAAVWEQMAAWPDKTTCLELAADAADKAGDAERARTLLARARSTSPAPAPAG